MTVFRWKAVVPLGVFLTSFALIWLLLLDPTVERSVEVVGARVVGARVDVDDADVRLRDGVVALRGLAVTDPDRPMRNLFEADEIVLNVRVTPLLEKKLIIDTVAVRGVRFGTPRATSGALERARGRREGGAAVRRDVQSWKSRVPLPTFSLAGLGGAVDVDAIVPESLETRRRAVAARRHADSVRAAWVEQLRALNPQPSLDSARALVERLEGASLRTLGLTGARNAVGSARSLVTTLTALDDRLETLQRGVQTGVTDLGGQLAAVNAARETDLAYARSLLRLPSLEAPQLAPALFGGFALDRVTPVLSWLRVVEQHLPPGIRTRIREGPDRTRQAGTTVTFPRRAHLPGFLVELAEASVAIGDSGAAAGNYHLRVADLTSAPAVHGRPTTFAFGRTEARVGPRTVRVGGMFDHVRAPIRDSVSALVGGIALPAIDLAPLGARLRLEDGATELSLVRTADSIDARFTWRSARAVWERLAGSQPGTGSTGQLSDRLADLLWRTVSGLASVEIEARLSGSLTGPRLAVGSNVAGAIARSLRQQLGAEVRRAERQVRARVDALIEERVAPAREAIAAVDREVVDRLSGHREEVARLKAALEERVRSLTRGIPGIGSGDGGGKGGVGGGKGR